MVFWNQHLGTANAAWEESWGKWVVLCFWWPCFFYSQRDDGAVQLDKYRSAAASRSQHNWCNPHRKWSTLGSWQELHPHFHPSQGVVLMIDPRVRRLVRSKPSLHFQNIQSAGSVKAEGGRGQLLMAASKEACHRYRTPGSGQRVIPLSAPNWVNIHPLTFPNSESSHTYTCIRTPLHHIVTSSERGRRHTEKNDSSREQSREKATAGGQRTCRHMRGAGSYSHVGSCFKYYNHLIIRMA